MTAEVERFRQEAEKMRRVPGIIFVDGVAGRRARITGTGLEVFEVIMAYRSVDWDYDRLRVAFYWLRDEQLRAAVTYYETYREEIDGEIAENDMYTPEYVYEKYPSLRPKPR